KEYMPIQMCFDSGSAITLINQKTYKEFKDPPRLRTGKNINLRGVGRSQTPDGFIKVPISVISDQGNLVEINVEAYVVKNMSSSFILGNDFSIQYMLSLIRDPDRSYIKLGRDRKSTRLNSSHAN